MCSDFRICLLACNSGKLKLVLFVFLVVRKFPAAVCHFWLEAFFFNAKCLAALISIMDSLAPESTSALTIRVLVARPFLHEVLVTSQIKWD
jgi:hypothetical protein